MRRWIVRGAALAGVAGLVAVLVSHYGRTNRPAHHVSGLLVPAGEARVYALSYRIETAMPMALGDKPTLAHGVTDLGGELTLRGLGRRGDGWLVALSLAPSRHQVSALGTELLPDAAAAAALFGDREAVLELAPDGALRAVETTADTPALFQNLVQLLAGDLQVTGGDGDHWASDEESSRGVARASYEVTGRDGGATLLHKARGQHRELERAGFTELPVEVTSSFTARVDETARRLTALSGREVLDGRGGARVAVALDLALLRVDVAQPRAAMTGAVRRAPGERAVDAGDQKRRLERLVAGLTRAQLLADLDAGGGQPRHAWQVRAAALLALDPAACGDLVTWFDEHESPPGRAYALELLAAAGSPAAQAAMRDALAGVAPTAPERVGLYSRLGLVEFPEADTVAAALAEYEDAGARPYAAMTLGNLAGKRVGDGDAAAIAALDRMVADLEHTDRPAEQAALLHGLGTGGRVQDTRVAARLVAAPSPIVRAAVADAMRGAPSPAGRDALLALAGDPDRQVQARALDALARYALDEDGIDALAALVSARRIQPINYPALVGVLARALPAHHDRVLAACDVIVADSEATPDVRRRIDAMRG